MQINVIIIELSNRGISCHFSINWHPDIPLHTRSCSQQSIPIHNSTLYQNYSLSITSSKLQDTVQLSVYWHSNRSAI